MKKTEDEKEEIKTRNRGKRETEIREGGMQEREEKMGHLGKIIKEYKKKEREREESIVK